MKKIFTYLTIIASLVLLAPSCVKENLRAVDPSAKNEDGKISLDGSLILPLAQDQGDWVSTKAATMGEETPKVKFLYLAVFSAGDILYEIVKAKPGTQSHPTAEEAGFNCGSEAENYITKFHVDKLTSVSSGDRYIRRLGRDLEVRPEKGDARGVRGLEGLLAKEVLVQVHRPAKIGLVGREAVVVLAQRQTLLHGQRAHVDLERGEARRIERVGRSSDGLGHGSRVLALAVDLVAQLAREAATVHHDGDVSHVRVHDLEALEVVDGLPKQLCHHLAGVGALHRIHVPCLGVIGVRDLEALTVRVKPAHGVRAVQRGEPPQAPTTVEGHEVIDDKALLVQHGGVLAATLRRARNAVHQHPIQEPLGISARHLHQVVGPAIPPGVLAHCLGLGARNLIFLEQHSHHSPLRVLGRRSCGPR